MENNDFRIKIYSKIDELPTLPSVVPRLLNLVEDKRTNAADITDLISHDPALAAKVMKVANSAYYGFSQEISDLNRAVALLGLNMVKSLALSIGVLRNLPPGKKSSGFSQKDLWLHSVAVAATIKEIGERHMKGVDLDHLFMLGLLHDIGIIVLDQFFPELFKKVLDESLNLKYRELHIAEQRAIGLDHGEIGAMLLIRWKFPEAISSPIAVHHQAVLPDGADSRDVAILRVADVISHEIGLDMEGPVIVRKILECDLDVLGIGEQDLLDLKEYMGSQKEGITAFFKAMV
ncbi:MAG: HDOD domain-containing protein [Deltaproteobacteria bacterium]|nr:HDOD domain-containing protein [Deltaproteobacteria bacterium]